MNIAAQNLTELGFANHKDLIVDQSLHFLLMLSTR